MLQSLVKGGLITVLKNEKMKKLVLMFAVIAGLSMASCGGKCEKAASGNDSIKADTTLVADSVAVDSVATDSVAKK